MCHPMAGHLSEHSMCTGQGLKKVLWRQAACTEQECRRSQDLSREMRREQHRRPPALLWPSTRRNSPCTPAHARFSCSCSLSICIQAAAYEFLCMPWTSTHPVKRASCVQLLGATLPDNPPLLHAQHAAIPGISAPSAEIKGLPK